MEVRFWQQSNRLMEAEPVYATAKRLARERQRPFRCAKLFWWFNQGADAGRYTNDQIHAIRILARAWIRVIWPCWLNHTPYDPARHGAADRRVDVGGGFHRFDDTRFVAAVNGKTAFQSQVGERVSRDVFRASVGRRDSRMALRVRGAARRAPSQSRGSSG